MVKVISSIILILSVTTYADDKYIEAQNKLAEAIYISSGIQENLNNLGKELESSVDKQYRPIIGWTLSTIDVIVKQRVQFRMGFP